MLEGPDAGEGEWISFRRHRKSLTAGHYFPAVVTALIVPDIAGAVDAPGARSQARYAEWLEKWFAPRFPEYAKHDIDGVGLYALRCKLLHEGLSDPSRAPAATQSAAATRKRLIAFNVDTVISMHLCTKTDANGETWTVLSAENFCEEIFRLPEVGLQHEKRTSLLWQGFNLWWTSDRMCRRFPAVFA